MLEKIRIKNFRCFDDFAIDVAGLNSVLLLGRNGSGKSTFGYVFQILQKMALQSSRVGDLMRPSDLFDKDKGEIAIEIVAKISSKRYLYRVALELPARFAEFRVKTESLYQNDSLIFERELAQINLKRPRQKDEVSFNIDWHSIALPIIQTSSLEDPISIFKNWLSRIVILRPIPSLMQGVSDRFSSSPSPSVENFGEWFSAISVSNPAVYEPFIAFLREVMPDISAVRNPSVGGDNRSIAVEFKNNVSSVVVPFERLSDGEKCYFICGLVIAAASSDPSFTCFWDEPDNYLAPQEVSPTIVALRRAFKGHNQVIVTSHDSATIQRFSDENTFIFSRESHMSSPVAKPLAQVREDNKMGANTIDLWLRGDLDA
jgi:hypothetical protein